VKLPDASSIPTAAARPNRAARTVLDALGVALFAAGLWSLAWALKGQKLVNYDEGILLTNPMLLLAGKVPYRDFYSNYPPGVFWLIAGVWKLTGVHAMVERYLGFVLHVAIALLAGRIGGIAVRRSFSSLAAGVSLAWLSILGNQPYAWLLALCAALAFIAIVGNGELDSRGRSIATGAAFGAVGCFRHDLFLYFALALVVLAGSWMVLRRRAARVDASHGMLTNCAGRDGAATELVRNVCSFVLAASLVLAALWVPTLARAGFARVAADLYFDQVRYVLPGRVFPFPDLFAMSSTPSGVVLPAFVGQPLEGGVVLTCAGPVLALIAVLLAWRSRRALPLPLVLGGALAVAVMPEVLGRTDLAHALYSVAPALVLGASLAEELAFRGIVASSATAIALVLPIAFQNLLAVDPRQPDGLPERNDGLLDLRKASLRAARREVLAFIDEHTQPGDPIYVGLWDHRWSANSEMDLYFLADRVGATRYMQFDPNLVNRAEVQEQMVRELDASRPKVAVLSLPDSGIEPNESARPGAALLDAYLQANYERVKQAERYQLLLRR
jgi:hypothetical protein